MDVEKTGTTDLQDKDEIAVEIQQAYNKARLKEEKERKIWKKCFEYTNNWVDDEHGQWKKEWREALSGRPSISFNEIRKFINRICGVQRLTKFDERAFPRDDVADPAIAEIITDLLKYVIDLNDGEMIIGRAFRDMVICGRGYVRIEWGDDYDPYGEICFKYVNPFRIFFIGRGEYYDLRDTKGIIEEIPMDKEEVLARWPKADDFIESLQKDNEEEDRGIPVAPNYDYGMGSSVPGEYSYDPTEGKYIVLRAQRVVWRDAVFIKNLETGKLTEAKDNEGNPTKLNDIKQTIELATQSTGQKHKKFTKKQRVITCTYILGNHVLEDEDSEYSDNKFDIVPLFAYTDGGRITGTAQDLLDPQDEKNKRHSQILHILGTSAKNSYFVKKGALDDIEAAKKEFGKIGAMIEVNGNLNEVVKVIESNLTAVPAIVNMDTMASQEMKEISGISDAFLGVVPQGVTSGRGINALQNPVETIIGELFENYRNSRKLIAQKIVARMQQFYTSEKRVRILGDYYSTYIPQNPQIQQMMQQGLVQFQQGMKIISINKQGLDKKLNDITVGRYDIVIDNVAQSPTMRRAEFSEKLNMKAQGAPVKWSTILRSYDGKGQAEMLKDAEEAEAAMAQMGAMPQLVNHQKNASPGEADQQFNLAGSQNQT